MLNLIKKFLSVILSVAIIGSCFSVSAFTADDNDKSILYISKPSELTELATNVNSGTNYSGYTFKLTCDIDLNNITFTPIGTEQHPFAGVFDGQTHKISNLNIQGSSHSALFGYNSGTIKNLKVEGNVTGTTNVAIIVGVNIGEILDCYSNGTVIAENNNVGGIAGVMGGGTIKSCYNMATIKTKGLYCGGIAGKGTSGKILYCTNNGDVIVTGNDSGGIVGCFEGGTISRCQNNNPIKSNGTCGGIVGYAHGGNVDNSLNFGKIEGTPANTGGVIGGIDVSRISYCFSKGEVTSNQLHGGAIGWNRSGIVNNCYSNSGTLPVVGQTDNTASTTACKALNDNEISNMNSFAGFDFEFIWKIENGHPSLKPEMTDANIVSSDLSWLNFEIIKGENTAEDNITKNLSLVLNGKYGSTINWTSSDASIMLDSGVALKPGNVTMTAKVSSNQVSDQKQFNLEVTADKSINPMHILQIGDSNTEYARITQNMNNLLKEKYGNYGDGYLTLCKNYLGAEHQNLHDYFNITYSGTWIQYDIADGATEELRKAQDSPFGLYLRNQHAGDTVTVTFKSSAVDIYYYSSVTAGIFSVEIDGEDKGEVNQKSDSEAENITKKASFENLGFGLHTMVIKNVSGDINFFGADYRITGCEKRANISTWGKAGIQAMEYANVLNPTIFDSALKLLNPDKVVLLIGTNDNGRNRCDAPTLEKYLNTILGKIKKALPNADILLESTFETYNDKNILHSYWDTAFPNAAKNNNVQYWSMGEWYGDYSTKLMADGWHSNNAGSKMITEKMYDVILSGKDLIGRNISSVKPLDVIKVKTGTTTDKLILPEKILVKLDDLQNSLKYVNVNWNKDNYKSEDGNYTLNGTIDITKAKRIYNPDNLSVTVNINVDPNNNPPAELITHYDFSNINNNTVPDLQKNYDATLVNAQPTTEGYLKDAVKFSGSSSSYVKLKTQIFDRSDQVTLSSWVNLSSVTNWTTLFSMGTSQTNYVVLAAKGNPNNQSCGLTMAIRPSGEDEYRIKADAVNTVPVNKWVQIVYTQENGIARLFLNGKKVAENLDMKTTIRDVAKVSTSDSTRLGAANVWGDPAVKGSIDEFNVYSRALSENEISSLYTKDVNIHNNPPPKHPENGVWIEGNKTVLYKNNIKVTGTKTETIGSVTYAVKDGFVLTGKIQLFSISNVSYIIDKNGVVQKSTATFKIINIGTNSYIIDRNGIVNKATLTYRIIFNGANTYVVDKYGLVQKSSKGYKLILKSYIVNTKGEVQKSNKGYKLISISKTSYIVNTKGEVQKSKSANKLISISKTSYIVNTRGEVQKSKSANKLISISKTSFIVNTRGEVQKSSKGYKLVKIGSKKYIVNTSGLVQKNKKIKVGNIQYKTDKKGIADKTKK